MGLGYGKDLVMFMPSRALIKLLVVSKSLGLTQIAEKFSNLKNPDGKS